MPPLNKPNTRWIENALLVGLIVLKFWLISGEEIEPLYHPHDELLFVNLADQGYCSIAYDGFVLSKQAIYPLFLSLVKASGMPYRLVIEALMTLCFLCLYRSLRRWNLNPWLGILGFAGMYFHPTVFYLNNCCLRDGFYAYLMILLIAQVIHLAHPLTPKHPAKFILPGITAALTWHTREESLMTLLLLMGFGCLLAWQQWRALRKMLAHWKPITLSALLLASPIILTNLGLRSLNLYYRGVFITCEFNDPVFQEAYRQLMRIRPDKPLHYVHVSRDALHKAYEASPSFARIKEPMENRYAENWENCSKDYTGTDTGVGGLLTFFALREAAANAGFHDSAPHARAFYQKVSDELKTAFREGKLESRFTYSNVMDPNWKRILKELPASINKTIRTLFVNVEAGRRWFRIPAFNQKKTLDAYDRVCNRRHSLAYESEPFVQGWMFVTNDPIEKIVVSSKYCTSLATVTQFLPRPDVVRAMKNSTVPQNCGYAFHIPMMYDPLDPSTVKVYTKSGLVIPLDYKILSKTGARVIPLDNGNTFRISVDKFINPLPRFEKQLRIIDLLRRHVGPSMPWMILAAFSLVAARLILFKNHEASWHSWQCLAYISGITLLILAMNSLLNISVVVLQYRFLTTAILLLPAMLVWSLQLAFLDMRHARFRFGKKK